MSAARVPRIAAGRVLGREHARRGESCQDAFAIRQEGERLVAVVTDGCGSARRSEVGAGLGAVLLATGVMNEPRRGAPLGPDLARESTDALTHALDRVAHLMTLERAEVRAVTAEYLLFSFLCLAVDGPRALIFGVGDGVVGVDDAVTVLDAGPDNAPPYVAYRLVGKSEVTAPRVHYAGEGAARFLLATDGLAEWDTFAGAELKNGGLQPSVRELARDTTLFDVPTRLGKRLNVVGQGHGRLHDDTTVVLVHRPG